MKAQKRPLAVSWIVLLLALCCGLNAEGGEDAARSEDAVRSGQRLAAVLAAKKTVADLSHARISGLERVWAQQILRDLPRHVQAAESQRILTADYRERLRGVLAERLRRIHTSFHPPGQKDRWFTEAWLTGQVQDRMRGQVEESLSGNAGRHLAEIFGAARQTAVREQSARLSTAVYPSVEEVEALIQAGWDSDSQGRIRRALVQRMSKGTLLLEETERQLSESAAAAVEEARAQFESQAEALDQTVPREARTAEDIARALAGHVEQARLRRKMAGGRLVYEPFPAIRRRLKVRAETLEKERFDAFCQVFSLPVSTEKVRSLVQSDLRRHRSPEASRTICTEELLPQAASEAVRRYAGSVADPLKAAAFRARLQGLAARDPGTRGILAAHLSTSLDAPLHGVRSSLAQSQHESHFPRLVSGRWSAPESVLRQIVQGELGIHTFEDCLKLPLLTSDGQSYQSSALLMETEDLVLSATSKLLAEGETAWKEQERVVRHFESEIPKAIRESKEDRSVVEWENHFIEKAEARWREERSRIWRGANPIPPYAAGKYIGLFQSMRELIRKHVKNEFEIAKQEQTPTLSTRAPEAKLAGPAPQASPLSGGGSGGGGKGAGSGGSKGAMADGSGEGGEGAEVQACPEVSSERTPVWWTVLALLLLSLVIAGVVWRVGARFVIPVPDLEEASRTFEHFLGMKPERLGNDSVVFKRALFHRIVLRQRVPGRPAANPSGAGAGP